MSHNKPSVENVPSGAGKYVSIVVAEWNDEITNALLKGAYDTLIQYGVPAKNIQVLRVPGTFELAWGAKKAMSKYVYWDSGEFSRYQYVFCSDKYAGKAAVICLGCVIQGETRHFEFISNAAAQGIMQLTMNENNIPVIFGVLTTENIEQARDRAGGRHGNKGIEAAVAALKMIR